MSYRIVVMSHKRPENLTLLKTLLNEFTVFVDPKEVEQYKPFLKEGVELITHTRENKTPIQIRQDILNTFKEDYIVFIDDDLQYVSCMVGGDGRRRYANAENIKPIIENGIKMLQDLKLSLFGWNRDPREMYFMAGEPLKLGRNFLAGGFIVKTGTFSFDEKIMIGGDVDLTLQGILNERIVIFDNRFYFNFGLTGEGKGGLQRIRSEELMKKNQDYLSEKWGKWADFRAVRAKARKNDKGKTTGIRFNIPRRSNLAII